MSTGAADYNTAIRQATKNLAERGVLTIDYQSGVHTSLEAAVRRNIMGGLGLMQEQLQQETHDELGCDGWEITAHANSAPDHEPIQGHQYSDAAYTALNNSLVRRIGTLNCGHAAFPIILGVSQPQYTDEELRKFREDNEKGVTYGGRHYTGYEATQLQRKLERTMRKDKRRILVDEASGDAEKLQKDQIRLQVTRQEYARFCKAAGLRTENERTFVAGFGRKQAAQARAVAQKSVEKPENSAKIVENLVNEDPPVQESKRYSDITGNWYPDAVPNSHTVQDLQSYTHDGVTYTVDGHNVVLDYAPYEKEIAELLEREVGGEMFMVPRVNNPAGIPTPDFIFRGKSYDLKSIFGESRNALYNAIAKKKRQSPNFVFDVSGTPLGLTEIVEQVGRLYTSKHTAFVDEIVIVKEDKIVKVFKRQ